MSHSLKELLALKGTLLADGATGTNLFAMGLQAGEAPELWNEAAPEKIAELHQGFVDAGADIILTNSFGGTRHRLKLHGADDRVFDLNRRAAEIARSVADAAGRPVIVAGSVGPTGELLEPLGKLTPDTAIAAFQEQIEGLKAGGADIAWIETMSAPGEILAASEAAILADMPYAYTASFDTAGRTMMGLLPADIHGPARQLRVPPVAVGANCGVGAPDILAALLDMVESADGAPVIVKGNCGIPQFRGSEIHYSGTPELMSEYVRLAVDAGAAIIGGCCGTSYEHLRAMRQALDTHQRGTPPTLEEIVARVGPLRNKTADPAASGSGRRERRRSRG